jgi:hypothetical protein
MYCTSRNNTCYRTEIGLFNKRRKKREAPQVQQMMHPNSCIQVKYACGSSSIDKKNSILDELKDILQFLFQGAIKLGEARKKEKACEN